jgi:hypothetical protein
VSQKPLLNKKPDEKNCFISSGLLYFETFFLKRAVLFRLFQKVMGDGNQEDREIGETPAGKARKETPQAKGERGGSRTRAESE